MRSRVCFDSVHSNRLRLLIEYKMSTGLHFLGEYRGSHIAFLFSLLASGPWLEADDTKSWDHWGRLCLMLWHIHTGAYPHSCMLASTLTHVRRQSVSPRNLLDIRVWVSPTFSLVSSYSRVLLGADMRSNSWYSLTQQGCAHRGIPHSLSYSLAQTIGSSVMYFIVFIEIFDF